MRMVFVLCSIYMEKYCDAQARNCYVILTSRCTPVLIEKLLYSCPLVEKVYVLLRGKKNVSAKQRFKNMLDSLVFSRLKAEKPDMLQKIVLVEGDLGAANLNMSSENLKIVREKAFVYVSTAFSNADRSIIEEIIYPPPASIEDAYKIAEQKPGDKNVIGFLNGWPNTYTYTKALAENLLLETHDEIPTVIVRPSIVAASVSEPVPGWIDNWYGATGVMTAVALGVYRTIYSNYHDNVDLIPIDYACNLILVAATRAKRSREILVYNSCSSSTNPISIGKVVKLFTFAGMRDGFNLLPFPQLVLYTKHIWLSKVVVTVMYFVAYMTDILLQILRKKPRIVEILTMVVMYQEAGKFFFNKNWLFMSSKALALAKSLSPRDYGQFPCNPQDIVWEEYLSKYFRGVKKFLIEKK